MPTYNIYMRVDLMERVAGFARKNKISVSKAVQIFCATSLDRRERKEGDHSEMP